MISTKSSSVNTYILYYRYRCHERQTEERTNRRSVFVDSDNNITAFYCCITPPHRRTEKERKGKKERKNRLRAT